jgi:microcystin-dependent protein
MWKKIAYVAAGVFALGAAYLFVPPTHQASAQYADQGTWGGTSAGSANAQTITIPNLSGNKAGIVLRFIPGSTNTGPTQINVSGAGLVNVMRPSSLGLVAFSGKEFLAGEPTSVMYTGSVYVLANNVDMTPIGKVVEFRGTTAPRGTLVEDGSCVSQTTYAALFSLLGTTWGSCSAGLFKLPFSNGRALYAFDDQGANGAANVITSGGSGCANATVSAIGGNCGFQNHALIAGEIPALGISIGLGGFRLTATNGSVGDFLVTTGGAGTTHVPGSTNSATWGEQDPPLIGNTTGTSGTAHAILSPASFVLRAIKY